MPGQNQVIAMLARRFPDAGVVGTENLKIALGQRRRVRAGHRNHSGAMRYPSGACMNPFTSAAFHRVANSVQTDTAVVVAADSEDWRYFAERAD
jgi:hypothetical protein